MSTFSLQPSPEHQAETAAKLRGEKYRAGPGVAAAQKRALDDAAAEYERVKMTQARERAAQGAPERVEAARQAVGSARTPRELDAAFASARRSLRR